MNAPGYDTPSESASDEAGGRVQILIVPVAGQVMSPALLHAVGERAAAGSAEFHLVLPDPSEHAELTAGQRRKSRARGEAMLEQALPLLCEAAGAPVDGLVSMRHDPMDVIEETMARRPVDEVMVATTHHHLAERLHLDLPHRLQHLRVPVTTVIAEGREVAGEEYSLAD
jgi:hypothetical protein